MKASGPTPGIIRRIGIVILGFVILFVLIWFVALQGSGDDNSALPVPTGSPVAAHTVPR